jgi:hypothetical protein
LTTIALLFLKQRTPEENPERLIPENLLYERLLHAMRTIARTSVCTFSMVGL